MAGTTAHDGAHGLPRLHCALRPSRELAVLLAAAHLCALAAILYALPQPGWRLLLSALIAAEGCRVILRHALLRLAGSAIAITLTGGQTCTLQLRGGQALTGRVLASSHVSSWLIVLDVALGPRRARRRVVLWRDSLAPQALRRLRVRLRWGWSDAAAQAQVSAPL